MEIQRIELLRVQDLMRAQKDKYTESDNKKQNDKLKELEKERAFMERKYISDIDMLTQQNLAIQVNYEKSQKENQNMQ